MLHRARHARPTRTCGEHDAWATMLACRDSVAERVPRTSSIFSAIAPLALAALRAAQLTGITSAMLGTTLSHRA